MEIQEFQPMIDGVLRKLKVPPQQREDMQQECYLEILENQTEIEASEYPLSYAETACRNRIIDLWRKDGRQVPADSLEDPKVLNKALRVPAAVNQITADMLAEALGLLGAKEYQAVLLSHVEGLTIPEIADVLDVSPRTVNNLLKSGMEKLRGYFQ